MARKQRIEVTPLDVDPDPLGSEEAGTQEGDLLGKIFNRQREARIAAAREEDLPPAAIPERGGQADTLGSTEQPGGEREAAGRRPPRPSRLSGKPAREQSRKDARLQESKNAGLQEDKITGKHPGERASLQEMIRPPFDKAEEELIAGAEQMGRSNLRDVASRLPSELDRWLERTAFQYEQEQGVRLSKQSLLKLAVQRLYIATERLGRLPGLED